MYEISYYLLDKETFPGKNFMLTESILSQHRSEARIAAEYLRDFHFQSKCDSQRFASTNSSFGICITIVTQQRLTSSDSRDLRPLSRVVARVLQLQNATCTANNGPARSAPLLDYTLHLCADAPFPEFNEIRQQSRAQLVSVHSVDEPPTDAHHHTDPWRKEQLDYAFCLRQALRKCPPHTRYVLALEDDALPRDEFDPLLRHLVFERLPRMQHAGAQQLTHSPVAVGYVKLYHPMRLSGFFNPEPANIAEFVALSLLLALVLFSIGGRSCVSRRFACRNLTRLLSSVSISISIGFLLVAVLSRQLLVPLRRVHPAFYQLVRAPSCCFPAVLFPVHSVEYALVLLARARDGATYAKDLLFDEFTECSFAETDAPLLRAALSPLSLSLGQLREHRQAISPISAPGKRAGVEDGGGGSGEEVRIHIRLRNYLFWPALVDHIGLFSGRYQSFELPWIVL